MATYNGSKYILKQLQSVLPQLSETDEIIISDDGSTDNTIDIINALNDKRIKIYHNTGRHNAIYNFENALKACNGDFIYLCDQDDVWFPEKVITCQKLLAIYDVVVSDCIVVDDNMQVIEKSMFAILRSGKGLLKNLLKNTYYGCCLCFKKSVLSVALPFPQKIPMHDIWIGFVAGIFFSAKFTNQPLVYYRRHSNNATYLLVSKFSYKRKIAHRINTLRYLPSLAMRYLKYRM